MKDAFYDELQCSVDKIGDTEKRFLCGNFNRHIGSMSLGYEGIHGGFVFGERNTEGGLLSFQLLLCDLQLKASKPHKKTFMITPKLPVWELKDPRIRSESSGE